MQPNIAETAVHTKSNLVAKGVVKREGSGPPFARRMSYMLPRLVNGDCMPRRSAYGHHAVRTCVSKRRPQKETKDAKVKGKADDFSSIFLTKKESRIRVMEDNLVYCGILRHARRAVIPGTPSSVKSPVNNSPNHDWL